MSISSILIDTSAWYALGNVKDRYHTEASEFHLAQAGHRDLVTTDLIVAETWTLIASRVGRPAALKFWESVRETRTLVLPVDSSDLEVAWRIVNDWSDQDFSFVDCATFALMERLGITEVFAFDTHFLLYRYGVGRSRAFRRLPK